MYIQFKDSLGNLLSGGTEVSPLIVGDLDASINEVSQPIKVTVVTTAGYKTKGDTTLSFTGTKAAKWSICATENGTYAPSLVISTEITTAGTDVWVKAASSSDEDPQNDGSVDLTGTAKIAAV